MKNLVKRAAATALIICAASVHAHEENIAVDSNHDGSRSQSQAVTAAPGKVIRYSAGDSIPLGAVKNSPAVETVPPKAVQIVRYSAGDSIPLGLPQPIKAVETKPAQAALPGTQGIRYSAGDSILLGHPSAMWPGNHAAAESSAAKKSAVYSSAANLPLAGALGDSVTTHIGISQAGLSEANGLINTSPAGLVGLFVVKAGIVYYLDRQPPEVRKSGLKTAAGIWSGFTMNNLLLIAGSTNPLSLVGGAVFGAYMYHREGVALEKEAASKAAQGFHVQAK